MKRTIALGAVWTASAAAAVGLGFLAVSLVDASASPGVQPVTATTEATGSASTDAPSAPPATTATAEYATAAGTVFADCTNGVPVLAGVPVAGWSVDDSNDAGRLEFKAGDQRVEVSVSCVGGAPVFQLDDSSGSSPSSPASATPGGGSSGPDRGGHGADDAPGDDSSGRNGGGHGSDG